MVPDCTNNSRKTAGISYHRVPTEKRVRQAWLVKIRRVNPCSRDNSFVCSVHFTPDSFEENSPGLVSGYRTRRRLKPDAVPSIFPRRTTDKPKPTTQRTSLQRSRQEVLIFS